MARPGEAGFGMAVVVRQGAARKAGRGLARCGNIFITRRTRWFTNGNSDHGQLEMLKQ